LQEAKIAIDHRADTQSHENDVRDELSEHDVHEDGTGVGAGPFITGSQPDDVLKQVGVRVSSAQPPAMSLAMLSRSARCSAWIRPAQTVCGIKQFEVVTEELRKQDFTRRLTWFRISRFCADAECSRARR